MSEKSDQFLVTCSQIWNEALPQFWKALAAWGECSSLERRQQPGEKAAAWGEGGAWHRMLKRREALLLRRSWGASRELGEARLEWRAPFSVNWWAVSAERKRLVVLQLFVFVYLLFLVQYELTNPLFNVHMERHFNSLDHKVTLFRHLE